MTAEPSSGQNFAHIDKILANWRQGDCVLLLILFGGTWRAGYSFQLSQRTGFQHGVGRDDRNGDLPFRL